jgi:HAD superfamily hydrolase (TIGR01509 family)
MDSVSPEIRTVLFDLDDTICEFIQSQESVLTEAFDAVDVDPFCSLDEYHQRYGSYLDKSENVEDLRKRCFGDIAEEQGYDPELGRNVAAAYSSRRDYSVRFLPGAREALTELAADYTLGLITNGSPEIQQPKLASLNLSDRFETVVYAGYETSAKPDPEPFHHALDTLNVSPENVVYVGNSLESDVAGAQAAHINAVWLSDERSDQLHAHIPEYTIDSLRELQTPPLPWE